MRGARLSIKFGVVPARGFVEFFRICRKFIPEPIEIDSLAALHQPFRIRSVEGEMPECVATNNVIPRSYSGKRGIDEDELAYAAWILGGKCIANHVADIVRTKISLFDLERLKPAGPIPSLGLFVIAARRPRRETKPAQVGHDHGMVANQPNGQRRPHVASFAVTMQQNDRRAV